MILFHQQERQDVRKARADYTIKHRTMPKEKNSGTAYRVPEIKETSAKPALQSSFDVLPGNNGSKHL